MDWKGFIEILNLLRGTLDANKEPYNRSNLSRPVFTPPNCWDHFSHLSSQSRPLNVLLLLLGNRDAQDEGVHATGHGRDQHYRSQSQRQRQKEGKAKKRLPAHRVAGLMEAGEVQS